MRLARLGTTVGLLLLGCNLFASDQAQQANSSADNNDNPKRMVIETNTTYQVLDHSIDLWHDAVLKGDDHKANFHLDEINDVIFEDIQTDKIQMKMLVRQIEHLYRQASPEGENLLEVKHVESEELTRFKEFLPLLASDITVKEELYKAMNRTEAFSNKYRLLGDYKNLLRRELGLPKLKMAQLPEPDTKQASTDQ